MIRRCYKDQKGSRNYRDYRGRGITVCDEWRHSFEAFYLWSQTSGYGDDLTLDRVDVDGSYSPDNCRWATPKEQTDNRRPYVVLPGAGPEDEERIAGANQLVREYFARTA